MVILHTALSLLRIGETDVQTRGRHEKHRGCNGRRMRRDMGDSVLREDDGFATSFESDSTVRRYPPRTF